MRVILFIALLSLVACAKQPEADPGVTCTSYVSPYTAQHPDSTFKKSNIEACSNATYKVTSLDPNDPSVYTATGVVIRLTSVSNLSVVTYQYTTFVGQ